MIDLMTVACPLCHAPAGRGCTDSAGRHMRVVHYVRELATKASPQSDVAAATAEAIAAWLERAGAPSLSMRVRAGEWKRRAAEEASKP